MRNDPAELQDPHALLAHDAFLRALARRLVLDDAQADDVVQQAWVAALHGGPDRPASLRSWLATAVRHFSAKLHRSESRRTRHEQAASRAEATPSVAAIVAREAARRRVVEALLRLEEPTRATLVLRYFEGLPPRVIARRQGVPVETVRTRIKRALERLRGELDREHGGDRATWGIALLPLAQAAPAGPLAVIGAATAAITTVASGVLVMSAKAKLLSTAAVVASVAAAWLLLHEPGPTDPRARTDDEPRAIAGTPAAAEATGRDRGDGAPLTATALSATRATVPDAPVPAEPAVEPRFATLQVKVLWNEDQSPAAGVGVSVLVWSRPQPELFTLEGTTDANGECRFEQVEPGELLVRCDRGDSLRGGEARTGVGTGQLHVVTLTIPPGPTVEGVVVDAAGRPVAGADVWLSDNGCNPRHGHILARSDAQGAFSIRSLSGIRNIGARAAGHSPSLLQWVKGEPGTTVRVRLALRGRGGAVAGQVVDRDGKPVTNARVQLGDEDRPLQSPPDAPHRTSSALLLNRRTDDAGRFAYDDAMPGDIPLAVRARGFAPWQGSVQVDPDLPAEVVVQLDAGFTLEGQVTDAEGQPAPDVELVIGQRFAFASSTTRTGKGGVFRLDRLAPGMVTVLAEADERGHAEATLQGASGETVRWDAVLTAGLGIHGIVVDEDGRPVEGCQIGLFGPFDAPDAKLVMEMRISDGEGRFAFPRCAPGRYQLDVRMPGPGNSLAAMLRDVRPDRDERIISVSNERRCTAWIEGVVVGADGRPLANAEVSPYDTGGLSRGGTDSTAAGTGRFRSGPFAPGEFFVRVRADGYPTTDFPVGTLGANETRDVGALRLIEGGALELRVTGDGHPRQDFTTHCRSVAAGPYAEIRIANGVGLCRALAAGDWELQVSAAGLIPVTRRITILPRETLALTIDLVPGIPVTLRATLAAQMRQQFAERDGLPQIRLLDAGGAPVASTWFDPQVESWRWELALAPGSWRLELLDRDQPCARAAFVVPEAPEPGATIDVELE